MYFYEHANGKIIAKPDSTVKSAGVHEYFDSPFVIRWWHEVGNHTMPTNVESDKSNPFA